MSFPVRYISAAELAAHLKGPDASSTRVVDVRDDDFGGGCVRTAVNRPAHLLGEEAYLDRCVAEMAGAKRVVFHCMFSQQRGPVAASLFAAKLQGGVEQPEVLVLSGGWRGWRREFGDDLTLTQPLPEATDE